MCLWEDNCIRNVKSRTIGKCMHSLHFLLVCSPRRSLALFPSQTSRCRCRKRFWRSEASEVGNRSHLCGVELKAILSQSPRLKKPQSTISWLHTPSVRLLRAAVPFWIRLAAAMLLNKASAALVHSKGFSYCNLRFGNHDICSLLNA